MRNNAAYLVACAAMGAAFAASPLAAAEVAHRWSFNGDWTDSVGGAYAVKCGIQRVEIPHGGYALMRKGR